MNFAWLFMAFVFRNFVSKPYICKLKFLFANICRVFFH